MIKRSIQTVVLAAAFALSLGAQAATPIKAVVVTHFEYGEATGDRPGELQFWVERLGLDPVDFPLGEFDLYLSEDGVLAICTGGGIPNAAASIMALGLDERFDLTEAYWLVAGISGGDPLDVSLGTGVWANHVVDGDLLYEIDGREIPDDWEYGMIPLGAKEPNETATGWTVDTIAFHLNQNLSRWAYELTRDDAVDDTREMKEFRSAYKGYPNAQKPPFVTMGDTLAASTYWHGNLLNDWANDWVHLNAGEEANMVTTNMEDTGTLTSLYRLARIDRVDTDRIMVLRTVSNYTFPPPGRTAAWSTTAPYPNDGVPALEAAFTLGNKVVQTLVSDWDQYRSKVPGSQ